MFTGLVHSVGRVIEIVPGEGSTRLGIRPEPIFEAIERGESIAVDGACLTVVAEKEDCFYSDVIQETLSRSGHAATEVISDNAPGAGVSRAEAAPAQVPAKKRGWLAGLVIAAILLLGAGGALVMLQSYQTPTLSNEADSVDETQARVEQLQAELEAKSAQLKQVELEKTQQELEGNVLKRNIGS